MVPDLLMTERTHWVLMVLMVFLLETFKPDHYRLHYWVVTVSFQRGQ